MKRNSTNSRNRASRSQLGQAKVIYICQLVCGHCRGSMIYAWIIRIVKEQPFVCVVLFGEVQRTPPCVCMNCVAHGAQSHDLGSLSWLSAIARTHLASIARPVACVCSPIRCNGTAYLFFNTVLPHESVFLNRPESFAAAAAGSRIVECCCISRGGGLVTPIRGC